MQLAHASVSVTPLICVHIPGVSTQKAKKCLQDLSLPLSYAVVSLVLCIVQVMTIAVVVSSDGTSLWSAC